MTESTGSRLCWVALSTAEAVAQTALNEILESANYAIKARGKFSIVLAGGTTPERVYQLLSRQSCDWTRWQLYLGDERCLPANHPDRNSYLIRHTLLGNISIPSENVHFIAAELGAEQAAQDYAKTIKPALPFDSVLLGMGEDGHTASLFPGHKHPQHKYVYAVYNAPKPPAERVSLSAESLSNNRGLLILVSGKTKRAALGQWKRGASLPISNIRSHGHIRILIDEDANPG